MAVFGVTESMVAVLGVTLNDEILWATSAPVVAVTPQPPSGCRMGTVTLTRAALGPKTVAELMTTPLQKLKTVESLQVVYWPTRSISRVSPWMALPGSTRLMAGVPTVTKKLLF